MLNIEKRMSVPAGAISASKQAVWSYLHACSGTEQPASKAVPNIPGTKLTDSSAIMKQLFKTLDHNQTNQPKLDRCGEWKAINTVSLDSLLMERLTNWLNLWTTSAPLSFSVTP